MDKYRRIRKKSYNENKYRIEFLSYGILVTVLILGVILGSLLAVCADRSAVSSAVTRISGMAGFTEYGGIDKSSIFRESLLRHMKIILLLWLFSFVNFGGIFSAGLLFIKSMGIGFAASLTIMEYGRIGLLYSLFLFLLQNAVLFVIYFIIANDSAASLAGNAAVRLKIKTLKYTPLDFSEKLVLLITACLAVLIISFYEANVCPFVFDWIGSFIE